MVALVLPGLFRPGHVAGAESANRVPDEVCAIVTFVEGAHVLAGSGSATTPVRAGQALYTGSAVQTDGFSRIELALAGGGTVRLAEDTTLELVADVADDGTPGVLFQVLLLKGRMWANFSKQHRENPVQVLAAGAMFTGPESVFRADMSREGAVEVKAYTGQVTASGPFELVKDNSRYLLESRQDSGDGVLEPWRCEITPYLKMIVLATGEASQPFRFAAKSDATGWVRWNEQRDEGGRQGLKPLNP